MISGAWTPWLGSETPEWEDPEGLVNYRVLRRSLWEGSWDQTCQPQQEGW